MKRYVLGLAVVAAGAAWVLSAPSGIDPADFAAVKGDAKAGEQVFWAAGCSSCHAKDDGSPLILAGGQGFATAFGTFYAPNITQDPDQGIGGWSLAQFARAIQKGVDDAGNHLYPALPYDAYNKMTPQDVADLWAYLQTLPPDATPSQDHDVRFPFNIRRALGLWKLLFVRDAFVIQGDLTPEQTRGRYIAEAMAHCGACHTPRNILGGMDRSRWLAGAATPDGKGKAPNISALTWSDADITAYLTTGFTPEFDSVGGDMAHIVDNMAKLPESDRAAVAAYLALVPDHP